LRSWVFARLRGADRGGALKLIVCPLAHLDDTLATKPSHVLSLISPDAEIPPCPGITSQRLVLRFNDIIRPTEGLTEASRNDIEKLIAFARSWHGTAPLLAHCWAGISRSTAAAYIIACAHRADGKEQNLAYALRHASPQATPNPLMIALADDILGRSGRMVQAIASIGRGCEAGQGDIFTLDLNDARSRP
jgi:predicted protein tyrosine phosphatase